MNMSLIKDLTLQIDAYTKLIDDLVDKNASDKVIGGLEMKRQKLIQRRNKLKQQVEPVRGKDKDTEIMMLKKQCEMLYDVAYALLEVSTCPKCEYHMDQDQAYYIDEVAKAKYDNADLLDELNLI